MAEHIIKTKEFIEWRLDNKSTLINAFIDEHKDEYNAFTFEEFKTYKRCYK